ncbi:MAG: PqqD family protein [Pyrinomonadaceae bacterium]
MINSNFPSARKTGLVVQEVPDEVLVFDLDTNKAHCLNETAAMVWKSCDGKTSIPEIAKIVADQTGKGVSDDLIWLAIDQLSENSLLEAATVSNFGGQSRREVIKKIGLASMIAIPVVASLIAPQNALAVNSCACVAPGSCTNTGCPCETLCNAASTCAPNTTTGVCPP